MDKILENVTNYLLTQGPWAVFCGFLVYVIYRLRKESGEVIKELGAELGAAHGQIQSEKDERRSEALQLSSKAYETLEETRRASEELANSVDDMRSELARTTALAQSLKDEFITLKARIDK